MGKESMEALRRLMQVEHLSALVLDSGYPHGRKCAPDYWNVMKWLTGKDDVEATVAVTQEHVAVWTDGAAGDEMLWQTLGEGVEVMSGQGGSPAAVATWLQLQLSGVQSPEVGVDGMSCTATFVESLIAELRKAGGMTVRTNLDVLQRVWNGRSGRPSVPAGMLPEGERVASVADRMGQLRRAVRQRHADGIFISAAEDVAWVLNLLVPADGMAAYLLIDSSKATLFADRSTLTDDAVQVLMAEGVFISDYSQVKQGLRDYFEYNILMDGGEIPYTLYKTVMREVVNEASPVGQLRTGSGGQPEETAEKSDDKPTSNTTFRGIPYVPQRPNGCLAALGWGLMVVGSLLILAGAFFLWIVLASSADSKQEMDKKEQMVAAVDSLTAELDDSSTVVLNGSTAGVNAGDTATTSDESVASAEEPVDFEVDSITGDTTYIYPDYKYENPYREEISNMIGGFIAICFIVGGLFLFVPGLIVVIVYNGKKRRFREWYLKQQLEHKQG